MILDDIVQHKKNEINNIKSKKKSLIKQLKKDKLTLIAEIKKASPSKGIISSNFKPLSILKKYQNGGADAISVLTDQKYFQGSNDIFKKVKRNTDLPVLRKEFIIDKLQIYESCLIGADIILLIAAILDKNKINKFLEICRELGMEAIVEIHNQVELRKVIETKAKIIGINNRNLNNFTVDINTTGKIIKHMVKKNIRKNYYIISESGIKTSEDIRVLKNVNIDGVLIGETLMKTSEPEKKIYELMGD